MVLDIKRSGQVGGKNASPVNKRINSNTKAPAHGAPTNIKRTGTSC